jgi:hypothetical protein
MSTPEQQPVQREIALDWRGAEQLPLYYANHLASQLDPTQGVFFITFGSATAPLLLGSPERVRAQAEAIETVPIQPIARIAVTREKLPDFIRALEENLARYDEAARMLAEAREETEAPQ